MAKGYWVVRVDVADPEKYKAYVAANAAPLPASMKIQRVQAAAATL